MPFVFLNIWTHRTPTYEAHANAILSAIRPHLRDGERLVVIGDFNSSPAFQPFRRQHEQLVERLETEFGLVSAYHAHRAEARGAERSPTLYWQHRQNQRFHIDYCFLPKTWVPRIRSVEVGSFEGAWSSDHRPLTVDVDEGDAFASREGP